MIAIGLRSESIFEQIHLGHSLMNTAAEDYVKTAVAPESGKANKAICALLAKQLGLPTCAVSVLRGQTNSQKCLLIEGMSDS